VVTVTFDHQVALLLDVVFGLGLGLEGCGLGLEGCVLGLEDYDLGLGLEGLVLVNITGVNHCCKSIRSTS